MKKEIVRSMENPSMRFVDVKILNKSAYDIPKYQTPYSSGVDLKANIDAPIRMLKGKTVIIPTGIFIQIPIGFEAQIRPRSGLAAKYQIFVLNTPGTIDADYRGEIKVILHKAEGDFFTINPGDRIAQMVFAPIVQANFIECKMEDLSTTERGDGGFGSTGRK